MPTYKPALLRAMLRPLSSARRVTWVEKERRPTLWEAHLRVFGHACAYCGVRGELTKDHVTPRSRGGPKGISNIVPACLRCNRRKGTKLLWREWTPPKPHRALFTLHPKIGVAKVLLEGHNVGDMHMSFKPRMQRDLYEDT